jgi:DNA-directed RNA polymerase subunit alpha
MSKLIHTPSIVKVDEHHENSATFTIEPLHTGYGMTLGNSFRRVLLSSIAGAAITSFRVEGVSHEFTTVPGIKEDLVSIMTNLKNVRFRLFEDVAEQLTLNFSGKGPIKAKNITTNSNVEIVNPDFVIANSDDSKTSLKMDLVVEIGRGYKAIEEGNSNRPSTDMISIDSIFTPVLRVRYKVENTRVGQITDLDKLLITIDTDGSISPKDAFEEAAAILINQYTALAGQTRVAVEVATSSDDNERESEDSDNSTINTPIEDLNLSARTTNALVNNEIYTLKDLFSLSDIELRELKGFGNRALDEVKEKLAELEL